jgi:hypothetical protein
MSVKKIKANRHYHLPTGSNHPKSAGTGKRFRPASSLPICGKLKSAALVLLCFRLCSFTA